jgi:catechol 2,3-dioxygenase-like lactoylglutathione lyase family enzyme
MFKDTKAFSSFSVDDIQAAKEFYGDTLGVDVGEEQAMGLLRLNIAGGIPVMIYPKDNHVPAEFTVLNFPVDDIAAAARELAGKGITFERYSDDHDELGVLRDPQGPAIAWFKDPAGNVLSIIQE